MRFKREGEGVMMLEERMCLYHCNNVRSRSGKYIVTNPTASEFIIYVKTNA